MADERDVVEQIHTAEDKDPKLNSYLDQIRDAGMDITKQWKEMWLVAFKYTWGRMLQNIKPKDDWNYVIINRIYPLMFSTISKLAKNNPKVLTFPWSTEKEGAAEFAEQWAGILQYIWESPHELNMRLKLIKGILDAAIFGYMVGKVHWEDETEWDDTNATWIGNVRHTFINPSTFWTDPTAETMEDADNCGTTRRVKMEWAQNRWPDFKDDIEKQAYTDDDPRYTEGQEIIYDSQRALTSEPDKRMMFNKLVDLILKRGTDKHENVTNSKQKYVTIEEIYWKDEEREHIKITDPVDAQSLNDSGLIATDPTSGVHYDPKTGTEFAGKWPMQTIKEYDKPKYPHGRFILRIGRTILNPDEESQKYKYKKWPFTVMPYHILPHMWQGGNAVEMVRNNNDLLNLTVSALVHRTRLTAEPERLIEANALARGRDGKVRQIKPRGLSKIIVMAKGKIDRIKNMEYAPMDQAQTQLAQIIKQDIDDSMFSQDTARGAASNKTPMQKGQGKMTATEAAKVDVNAHDYTAMQSIFLDGWVDDTLSLIAEVVQVNYPEGRRLKIIGVDQERHMQEMTGELKDVDFDVNIVPGSTMPFDKEKKKQEHVTAFEALGNPAPNPMMEEFLQVMNIPNRKKIMARHQGTILFSQFVQMAAELQEIDPAEMQKILELVPQIQPVYELLMQAGQLAVQPQVKPPAKKGAA